MKEDKYRGKLILGKHRWVKGFYVRVNDNHIIIPAGTGGFFDYKQCEPETIGQYIGRRDRKNKEIYDGDILYVEFADKSGGYQLVGWNEETASWGVMDIYSYQSTHEGYDFAEFNNHVLLAILKKAVICEVAGNIHDNPELMNNPEKRHI